MDKVRLFRDEISYDVAEPASWPKIFLYVLTAGLFGELFVRKQVKRNRWSSIMDERTHFNCRCSVANINPVKDHDEK